MPTEPEMEMSPPGITRPAVAHRPVRVLLISHTCQSATEGQAKARELARFPDLHMRVLTPDRWRHYGNWRGVEDEEARQFELEVGRVALPWALAGQYYLHWYPGLRRTLAEFQPDIIDLWEEPWGLVSAQACWLRDRAAPRARMIAETEQNIALRLPPPFCWFQSYVLKSADYAIGRSAGAVAALRAKGYRGPAETAPNGVDAQLFAPPTPQRREQLRRELGLSGFVVGYVGRLVVQKGIMDAVEALAKCPPDVYLLVVGDGPLLGELRRRAAGLQLENRVRLVGAKPPGELAEWIGAMDALALPSRTTRRWKEQFGRVIIEAHCCGIPVIGSDSGAIPEVVGGGGIIFREANVAELAAAITSLRADPRLGARLATIGREQVQDKYTWQRAAEQMRRIYLSLAPDH